MGYLDLLMFNVILGSFSACLKLACNSKKKKRKKLAVEWNFGLWAVVTCIWVTFNLFSVQGHFGVIWRTCLKMVWNSKRTICRLKLCEIWESCSHNMCTGCLWPLSAHSYNKTCLVTKQHQSYKWFILGCDSYIHMTNWVLQHLKVKRKFIPHAIVHRENQFAIWLRRIVTWPHW